MKSVEVWEESVLSIDRRPPRHRPVRDGSGRWFPRALVGMGVLIGALMVFIWLGSGGDFGGRGLLASSPDQLSYVEVTVKRGDTLWSLARRHGPEHRDIRETIDRIRTINGLETRVSLRPGERLTIPIH